MGQGSGHFHNSKPANQNQVLRFSCFVITKIAFPCFIGTAAPTTIFYRGQLRHPYTSFKYLSPSSPPSTRPPHAIIPYSRKHSLLLVSLFFRFFHTWRAEKSITMRLSCNGCRVLRKGCSKNCTIRPCLQWISCPESQAHATMFLAKFYGRAGLINLINAPPEHLRQAVFRSLLYEACGRIVNPVYGSIGLLGNGNWNLCHEAVEAVLRGEPIDLVPSSTELDIRHGDIRHITKDDNSVDSRRPCKVNTKAEFKRSAAKPKHKRTTVGFMEELDVTGSMSHDPLLSWLPRSGSVGASDADSVSVETVEPSLAKPDDPADLSGVDLELTLGLK